MASYMIELLCINPQGISNYFNLAPLIILHDKFTIHKYTGRSYMYMYAKK